MSRSSSLRWRVCQGAAVLLAVAALGAVTAMSANAYDAHGCPSGWACGWTNGSFGGPPTYLNTSVSQKINTSGSVAAFVYYYNHDCPSGSNNANGTWNDCISAVTNDGTTGCSADWWTSDHWNGLEYVNNWETGASYVGDYWNDRFSSLGWC
jgi:hypothetical protein